MADQTDTRGNPYAATPFGPSQGGHPLGVTGGGLAFQPAAAARLAGPGVLRPLEVPFSLDARYMAQAEASRLNAQAIRGTVMAAGGSPQAALPFAEARAAAAAAVAAQAAQAPPPAGALSGLPFAPGAATPPPPAVVPQAPPPPVGQPITPAAPAAVAPMEPQHVSAAPPVAAPPAAAPPDAGPAAATPWASAGPVAPVAALPSSFIQPARRAEEDEPPKVAARPVPVAGRGRGALIALVAVLVVLVAALAAATLLKKGNGNDPISIDAKNGGIGDLGPEPTATSSATAAPTVAPKPKPVGTRPIDDPYDDTPKPKPPSGPLPKSTATSTPRFAPTSI